MNDLLDEEMQIASEQDSAGTTLDSDTFKLPIKDVTLPNAICVETTATIGDALALMHKNKVGSIIITKDGKLAGIVTERDFLLKVIGIIDNFKNESITKIMTPDPTALMPEDMIAYVLNNMHVGGYRHVPIINDKNEPIAIISIKDVMSFILDHFPEDIANITGEPYRGPITRDGG